MKLFDGVGEIIATKLEVFYIFFHDILKIDVTRFWNATHPGKNVFNSIGSALDRM